MDNIVDAFLGLDKRNEIFNLWYEITYLRMIISQVIPAETAVNINYDKIRQDAQEVVRKRFPNVEISFRDTSRDENP